MTSPFDQHIPRRRFPPCWRMRRLGRTDRPLHRDFNDTMEGRAWCSGQAPGMDHPLTCYNGRNVFRTPFMARNIEPTAIHSPLSSPLAVALQRELMRRWPPYAAHQCSVCLFLRCAARRGAARNTRPVSFSCADDSRTARQGRLSPLCTPTSTKRCAPRCLKKSYAERGRACHRRPARSSRRRADAGQTKDDFRIASFRRNSRTRRPEFSSRVQRIGPDRGPEYSPRRRSATLRPMRPMSIPRRSPNASDRRRRRLAASGTLRYPTEPDRFPPSCWSMAPGRRIATRRSDRTSRFAILPWARLERRRDAALRKAHAPARRKKVAGLTQFHRQGRDGRRRASPRSTPCMTAGIDPQRGCSCSATAWAGMLAPRIAAARPDTAA